MDGTSLGSFPFYLFLLLGSGLLGCFFLWPAGHAYICWEEESRKRGEVPAVQALVVCFHRRPHSCVLFAALVSAHSLQQSRPFLARFESFESGLTIVVSFPPSVGVIDCVHASGVLVDEVCCVTVRFPFGARTV